MPHASKKMTFLIPMLTTLAFLNACGRPDLQTMSDSSVSSTTTGRAQGEMICDNIRTQDKENIRVRWSFSDQTGLSLAEAEGNFKNAGSLTYSWEGEYSHIGGAPMGGSSRVVTQTAEAWLWPVRDLLNPDVEKAIAVKPGKENNVRLDLIAPKFRNDFIDGFECREQGSVSLLDTLFPERLYVDLSKIQSGRTLSLDMECDGLSLKMHSNSGFAVDASGRFDGESLSLKILSTSAGDGRFSDGQTVKLLGRNTNEFVVTLPSKPGYLKANLGGQDVTLSGLTFITDGARVPTVSQVSIAVGEKVATFGSCKGGTKILGRSK